MTALQNVTTRAAVPATLDAPSVPGAEAAAYIEAMCSELSHLAERSGQGFLAYLLEVAREEALLHAHRP